VDAFVRNFAELFVLALLVLVFGRIVVSWLDPTGRNKASVYIVQATEPILAPVRRALPQTGMIDLSPTIVVLVLFVLLRLF
jgi:YggT family protein